MRELTGENVFPLSQALLCRITLLPAQYLSLQCANKKFI